MSNAVISGGNLFNTKTAFPGSTLVADEEAGGHESYRIATGRRSPYTNYYTSITANAQRTLTLTCDRSRSADLFALDRGHNLAGKELILECSDDNFTTMQTVFDVVLPSATAPGSLDDALGVRTDEGAWMIRFTKRSALYWRLRIPAMGASLRPKIVGAHLSVSFAFLPWMPDHPDQVELGGDMTESDAGWRAMLPFNRLVDQMRIQLTDLFAYELWRDAFQHFVKFRPAWYVPDELQAQNARVIAAMPGTIGVGREPDWYPHRGVIPYIEHEAA